jgi:FtsP/CotA-like multicopper oxidase with cupredoxin domain
LALLALAVGGAVLAGTLAPTASPQPTAAAGEPLLTAAALAQAELFRLDPEPWRDPPEARREPGKPYPLVIDFARNTVRVGEDGRQQSVNLRSYNGGLVGPTLRVKPGETLLIDLVNRLPKGTGGGDPHAHAGEEHCGVPSPEPINSTNLHTHGLHVSPSGSSDNVLRVIPPGGPGAQPERYVLPILPAGNPPGEPAMEHYPGTLWYHAHLHGSTAAQLASGMAGALIVEGDIDGIPQVQAAKERIFVFQQLAFDKDGEVKSIGDLFNNWIGDQQGSPPKHGPAKHTTINGVTKPLIVLARRQVERWRMIDAGIFELLTLSLRKKDDPRQTAPFNLLALDGITMKQVEARQEIELGPGYRAEALVQAPDQAGEYLLYKSKPAFSLLALGTEAGAADTNDSQIIAVVRVEDRACVMPSCSTHNLAPGTRLPAPLRDIEAREVQPPAKPVTFSFDGNFKINDHCFLPDRVLPEFDLTKGRTEEWVLRNTSDGVHPFHIHVNPFQTVNPDGTPGVWRDTLIIPPKELNLRIRTRIERFTGRFVTHCHILLHEDKGMMQLVQVSDPREP